jgi:hypothetical protein
MSEIHARLGPRGGVDQLVGRGVVAVERADVGACEGLDDSAHAVALR